MGRDFKEEERPRELGREKKKVNRMGRDNKGEQRAKRELGRDKQLAKRMRRDYSGGGGRAKLGRDKQ